MKIKQGAATKRALAGGVAFAVLLATAAPSLAAGGAKHLTMPAQPLEAALRDLGRTTGTDILFQPEAVRGLRSTPLDGDYTAENAARTLVEGTKLSVVRAPDGSLVVQERSVARPQDPAGPATGPSAGVDPMAEVAELIVTANKREERLHDVASAVTALPGDALRRTQATRFEDYLTKVPGLNYVSTGEGTTQLILRGITSGAGMLSSTVGIYVDDAPYGSSTVFAAGAVGTPDLDTSDLLRIEVLKGPQGTLYGAGSLGGLLKFVTTPPDTVGFTGRLDAGASSVDGGGSGHKVSAMLNVPLVTDRLALRISAYDRRDPGFIDDPGRGRTDINAATVQGGRLALLWKATDDLSITLSGMGQDLKAPNPSSEDVSAPGLAPLGGDRTQSRLIDSSKRFEYRLYTGAVDWDLHWAHLLSSTSYSTFRETAVVDFSKNLGPLFDAALGLPAGFSGVNVSQPVREEKVSQEIRLQSPDDQPLEWRVGAFYTHENSVQEQHIFVFAAATGARLPIPNAIDARLPDRYTETAGFADLTYHFTPRFDVTVGGRYSHNEQHFSEQESGLLVPTPVSFGRSSSDNSTTWLINPRFKLNDDVMFYGRIATGYRPGGPTTIVPGVPAPTTFEPDTLTDYEVGVKASLLDRRLNLDADAFYIDWRKIQLNETVNGFVFVANGGKARSQGFEASVDFAPISGLNLSGNLAYTDAQLTSDAPGIGGVSGDRLPGVPHWNAAFDASYSWTLATGWKGFVGGGYRFVGARASDFFLLGASPGPRLTLPSYEVVDLRVGAEHDGWTLTVYAKNLGDERGILAAAPNTGNPVSGSFSAAILQPRTFGIDLAKSF